MSKEWKSMSKYSVGFEKGDWKLIFLFRTNSYDFISSHFILSSHNDPTNIVGTIRFLPYPIPTSNLQKIKESEWAKGSPLGGVSTPEDLVDSLLHNHAQERPSDDQIIQIKFGRVAISKEARGMKLGEKMLLDCEDWFLQAIRNRSEKEGLGIKEVEFRASSQHFVVGFYERWVRSCVPWRRATRGKQTSWPHHELHLTFLFTWYSKITD